jgi:hypothetical protein
VRSAIKAITSMSMKPHFTVMMQFLIEVTVALLQSFDVFEQSDLKLDLEEAAIERKVIKISAARGCASSTRSMGRSAETISPKIVNSVRAWWVASARPR